MKRETKAQRAARVARILELLDREYGTDYRCSSSRRDLTAKICQHITLSSARRSHGLTRPHSHSSRAGTAVDMMTTAPHRMAPAARSPAGVLSFPEIRFPYTRAAMQSTLIPRRLSTRPGHVTRLGVAAR